MTSLAFSLLCLFQLVVRCEGNESVGKYQCQWLFTRALRLSVLSVCLSVCLSVSPLLLRSPKQQHNVQHDEGGYFSYGRSRPLICRERSERGQLCHKPIGCVQRHGYARTSGVGSSASEVGTDGGTATTN